MTETDLHPDEEVLPDNYPVHAGYFYVRPWGTGWAWFVSMISGTVADLKRDVDATTIRRCNMISRGLFRNDQTVRGDVES